MSVWCLRRSLLGSVPCRRASEVARAALGAGLTDFEAQRVQAMGPPRGARPRVSQLLGQPGVYRCLVMHLKPVAPATCSAWGVPVDAVLPASPRRGSTG